MLDLLELFPDPQGAGACILAFSTTDRDSFDAVESWYKKVAGWECHGQPVLLFLLA